MSLSTDDSLGLAVRPAHLPLDNMARNYRSSSAHSVRSPNRSNSTASQTEAAAGGGTEPAGEPVVDPLDSLRSRKRQEKEFSFKDCLYSSCRHLYDFTIASCQYTFCNCCCSKRRNYERIDGIDNEPDGSTLGINEEISKIKSELKFHFMNPFEKWKYPSRRRFPWKLIVQLIVILLATVQLWIVAKQRIELQCFVFNNKDTFEKLFVMDSDCPSLTDYYDTASVSTITTKDKFWDQLNYTVTMYYTINATAIGPYGYGWDYFEFPDGRPPVFLHVEHYLHKDFKPEEKTYDYFGDTRQSKYTLYDNDTVYNQLIDTPVVNDFDSITHLWFEFNLSSFYVNAQSTGSPLCAQFSIKIRLVNSILSGNMPVYVDVVADIDPCLNKSTYTPATGGVYNVTASTVLGSLVIVFTIISTIQCIRSITTSGRFTKRVRHFFLKHFNYKLSLSEYLPLYNLWFVGAIISNLLVDVGTVLFLVTNLYFESAIYELNDVSSIIYGMGVFFQWLGLLRFLSYFDKYNMLLITLRLAIPNVIRFMVCGFIFYVAFLLVGWLVLGPYHPKFADPSITSECLYSLINGDDMFNTYIQMDRASFAAFIFSKIYLYVFISLFIYVVLSVFISLISDTYETLHELWSVRSRGLLQDFANDCLGHAKTQNEQGNQTNNDDNDFELLTGSNHGSNTNSPLITHGIPLITRSDQFHGTPTLQLHPTAANSPRLTARVNINSNLSESEGPSLYPRLGPGVKDLEEERLSLEEEISDNKRRIQELQQNNMKLRFGHIINAPPPLRSGGAPITNISSHHGEEVHVDGPNPNSLHDIIKETIRHEVPPINYTSRDVGTDGTTDSATVSTATSTYTTAPPDPAGVRTLPSQSATSNPISSRASYWTAVGTPVSAPQMYPGSGQVTGHHSAVYQDPSSLRHQYQHVGDSLGYQTHSLPPGSQSHMAAAAATGSYQTSQYHPHMGVARNTGTTSGLGLQRSLSSSPGPYPASSFTTVPPQALPQSGAHSAATIFGGHSTSSQNYFGSGYATTPTAYPPQYPGQPGQRFDISPYYTSGFYSTGGYSGTAGLPPSSSQPTNAGSGVFPSSSGQVQQRRHSPPDPRYGNQQ